MKRFDRDRSQTLPVRNDIIPTLPKVDQRDGEGDERVPDRSGRRCVLTVRTNFGRFPKGEWSLVFRFRETLDGGL